MIPTRSHHEHSGMHTVYAPYRGYLESSWGMREQPRVRAGEAASSTNAFRRRSPRIPRKNDGNR